MDFDRFFTRINPLIVATLRTPGLHYLLSPGCMLVTITGRKSGKRYSIPLGYQPYGSSLITLVSKARRKNWWRNFRDPWAVEILLRRRPLSAEGELLDPRSDAFREHAERTFRRMPWLGRQFDLTYDRKTGLTDAQIEHLGREAAIVEFRLQ